MKKLRKIFTVILTIAMIMSLNSIAFAVGPIEDYRCDHDSDTCYEMVPDCGKHVHDSTCEEVCDQEILDLICGKEEHSHETVADCILHGHTDECKTMMVDTAKCIAEEHSHTDACKHQHTIEGGCYVQTCLIDSNACLLEACDKEVHEHSDACQALECTEEAHEHTDACQLEACDKVVHVHTSECQREACNKEVYVHSGECHIHAEGTCSYHQHIDSCYNLNCEKNDVDVYCGKDEHTHTDDCKSMIVDAAKCSKEDGVCEFEEHTHDAVECYAPHEHIDACMKRGELICTLGNLPADLKTATYAASGIDFNLYNYSQEINLVVPVAQDKSAAKTVLSQYFNFSGHGSDGSSKYTAATKAIGQLDKGHFTYERNLGTDGAPVITWASVNNDLALESAAARSIGYVFGAKDHFAVTAYEGILNTPLSYNPATGYYEYDSAENAVDFDAENNWLYVRGYKDQGKASADANGSFDSGDGLADFFPFNSRIQTDENGKVTFVQDSEAYQTADGTYYHYDTSSKTPLTNPDYWFGASMNASFYYPQDGYWKGAPMKYEFSGDDDVMVYIDGIYVMDLGGAHSRASGEIDFATGLVETWLDAANQPQLCIPGVSYDHKEWAAEANAAGALYQDEDGFYCDNRGTVDKTQNNMIRYYPTTIYDCYKAAYQEQGMAETEIESKLAEVFVPVYNETTGEQEVVYDAYGDAHPVYRFRDYSVHEFDWFYLERHSWEANFYTKFNLPTIPQNSLTIEKIVEDSEDLIDDNALYAFEVWATDQDGNESEKIDTIVMTGGERVVINDMIQKTMADYTDDHYGYIVKELGQILTEEVDGVPTSVYSLDGYTTSWTGTGSAAPVEGCITAELSAEEPQVVTFTNRVNPADTPNKPGDKPPVIIPDEPEEPPLVEVEDPEIPLGDEEMDEPLLELEDEAVPMEGLEIEDPAVPKTSDNSNLILWLMLTILSAAGIIGTRQKEKKDH